MTITVDQILFLLAALVTLGAAITVVTARNLVHAALALIATFFGVAILFVLLQAGFLATVQVVLYIGAIAILTVFAILLTRGTEPSDFPDTPASWRMSSVIVVAVFGVIVWAIRGSSLSHRAITPKPQVTVKQIGEALMGPYVLPLEVIGLLLTAALIGAVILAMYDRQAK